MGIRDNMRGSGKKTGSKGRFADDEEEFLPMKPKPGKKKTGNLSPSVKKTVNSVMSGKRRSVERAHKSRVLLITICAILIFASTLALILHFFSPNGLGSGYRYMESILSSTLGLLFAVIILDNINAHSDKQRRRRDERSAILRHNRIIQPVVDLYIVRKNMVITPNDRTVRKFQVDARFTIKDMKDMYSPSELVSDVGKSKIETYSLYQEMLHEKFVNLVENIDFSFYPELCDAAMKYITATSYGASALSAVVGYQSTNAGTKTMKGVVINLIREEPENGKFIDAPPALKNVYLLHQTINEQETALLNYLKIVQSIQAEETKDKKFLATETVYE